MQNAQIPAFRIFFSSLLLCFSIQLAAQVSVRDSLIREISKAEDDTRRFWLINSLVTITYPNNPDSAYRLLAKILPQAEEIAEPRLLMELYYSKGLIYAKRAQYDSTLYIYNIAKKMAIELDDKANLIHILDQIGHAYHYQNQTDKGLSYLRESFELAIELGDKNIEFKQANNIGRVYSSAMKTDSAYMYLNRALTIQEELNNLQLQSETLTNLGGTAVSAGDWPEALEYFNRALFLMRKIKFTRGISVVYNNIAVVHYFKGDFPKALENFHKAFEVVEGTEHVEQELRCLDDLGEVYLTLEDYDHSLYYLEKAVKTWTKVHGTKENSDFSFKKGRAFLLKKEYPKALQFLRESIALKKAAGQFIDGNVYRHLAQTFGHLSEQDSAFYYYEKGLKFAVESNTFLLEAQCLTGLGEIHEARGEAEKAMFSFQKAYQASIKLGSKEEEMNAAEGLYRVNKKLNNDTQALKFLEKARSIQDSLFNEKNLKDIARMEANFEFEKEKQKLAYAQEQENEKQEDIRKILGIALIVTLLLLLIAFGYYRAKQLANKKLNLLNQEMRSQKNLLEKQKAELEELDEVKSHLFTNISHEFRTPLTIISGMSDQIKSRPDVWLEKGAEMIKQNSLNLLSLVNQMLDLRKLESNSLQLDLVQGNVIDYLKYIVESYQSFAESKKIKLHFLTDVQEVKMDYDPHKLQSIISNLLSNAIKHTPKGGDIYFQINPETEKTSGQESLTIRVKDTGTGIPQEQIPHVFNRFYRGDDSTGIKGTGIGLALTQELVKVMGGEIEVISEYGKGSTFMLILPITQKAQDTMPQIYTPIQQGEVLPRSVEEANTIIYYENKDNSSLPKLLIVEDNRDVVQFLVACLENDYQLEIACNGQVGIDKAIACIPDLILSDVMMPEKCGFELCDTLKKDERTSHIPIVLLTAKADMDSRLGGLERGADAYLTKPFDQKELLVRLKKLLELRTNLQERFSQMALSTRSKDLNSAASVEDAFLIKIRTIVEENLSDSDLGMARISRELGMSRSQIFRKVKALTGKSPTLFIRAIRLHKAKCLLQNSDLNISEIGYEVGFSSLNYFSSAFFEEFGVRPSATRK